jgi:hypothetical protein
VKVERTTFSVSRAAEYLDARELAAQTGQPVSNFATVALKELGDNALDASETAGVYPKLSVAVDQDGDRIILTVSDNGSGIEPEVVERILDFNTRTSDKALYRTPSRGLQGNALKTIAGLPFALGDEDPLLSVAAHGVEQRIQATLNGAGIPEVAHEKYKSVNSRGTSVTVGVLARGAGTFNPRHLMRAFAVLNPHADVTYEGPARISNHATSEETRIEESHIALDPGYKKFKPTDPLVIHWYDARSFERLVLNLIEHGNGSMHLSQFLRDFRGFSNSGKAKEAAAFVPYIRTLSDFKENQEAIRILLDAMQAVVKEPTHNVLGSPVGKEHLRSRLAQFYGGVKRTWYKNVKTALNGAPAVVEVLVAETEEPGEVFYGINHSPTYEDPVAGACLSGATEAEGPIGYGALGFLKAAYAFRGDDYYAEDINAQNTAAVVHIIAAAPATLDRGKTRLSVADDWGFQYDLALALWTVTKTLHKEAKKRGRDAAAALRAARRRDREHERRIPKANACFDVMEEAYAYSTGDEALPTSVRDLYYAVRNRIERFGYDADELAYNDFSQRILTDYRQKVRELPNVFYDPRGVLHEPHGGSEVRLGTKSVAEYALPEYKFDKILYIEKKGRVEILKAAQIPEKHDMALIGGEGFASEAIRKLLENAEEGDFQLFVLHDADPYGYNIALTLAEETRRMPGYSVDVIDIGLRLEDALAMGKRPETFTRKRELPERLYNILTDVEQEHFVGEEGASSDGKRFWIAKRVELNDLSSPELVEYVEEKLVASGVRGKVIPPDDKLGEMADGMYRALCAGRVEDYVDELICAEELKREIANEFADTFGLAEVRRYIEEQLKDNVTLSWSTALEAKLEAIQEENAGAFKTAVEKWLREVAVPP